MSAEVELRKWLHRDTKSHTANIAFCIKVWNSIEFNLLTKHEIITQEFCNILTNLSAEVTTDKEIDAAWTIINEFLALKCSPGAVVSSVKLTLITTLVDVIKPMKCPRYIVYKGLIALLQNSSIQSFFKSNAKPFAKFVGASINCLERLLETNDTDSGFDVKDPLNAEIIKVTRNYIKQTPFLDQFRKPFVKYVLLPLTEFFIKSRKHGIVDESDFFTILHEIYFAEYDSKSIVKEVLLQPENNEFVFLFDVPVHVFMLIVEGVLQPLKIDSATQSLFIEHLFNVYFKESNDKFVNEKQMLLGLSHFLVLLRRYDVSLNFNIDGIKAVNYIGKNIESLNVTESNLYEVLSVLCASIELNPMMLEQEIIPIVIKCMLHRKDDRTMRMFERFLILVIDMYRRLSRSEKFISNLIRSMWQKLTDFKFPKKLKRKLCPIDGDSSVNGIESEKKMRLDSIRAESRRKSFNDSMKEDPIERNMKWFLLVLDEPVNLPDGKSIQKRSSGGSQSWKNIQFAWPNTVGEAFSKFVSGSVSKPSLVVWKTLIFTLKDYVKLLKDGDFSENTLFFIEWTSALLCQYFDGCRLAEQSDKTWELIENNRKLQRSLLKDFGNAILSQEHNIRTMNAFLSLCHSSASFDLLSWCYCPDSITIDQIERSMGDSSNDFIHSYLQPTEWVLIEQRITNFGKQECRTNLNRLYLQKIKSKSMFKRCEMVDISCHLLASTLGNEDGIIELNEILVDETTNHWFIKQLSTSQKIFTARRIVELDCIGTRNNTLTSMLVKSIQDQEFFDFLTVSVFERIAMETEDPMFVLNRISYDDVFTCNDSVCKELIRGIRQSGANTSATVPESNIAFKLLNELPLGFVSLKLKNILVHLILGLMCNGSKENVRQSYQYFKKLLLHGDTPDVFRYLKVKHFPRILNFECEISEIDREVIYQLVFEKSLTELTPSTMKMLEDLLELLRNEKFANWGNCSFMALGIRMLEYLSRNKMRKEYCAQYRDVILEKIREFFNEETVIPPETQQHFISITSPGFVNIISTMLAKGTEFNDTLKRINKLYLQNMEKCYDSHSIKLLNVIVTNKVILGYVDDDITKVVNKFWNQFVNELDRDENPDRYEPFLKFVLNFKSAEELVDMLTAMNLVCRKIKSQIDEKNLIFYIKDNDVDQDEMKKFVKFEKLFRLIFKCQMNKAKGSICSEFFRRVSFKIILSLRILPQPQSIVRNQLLECQKQLSSNTQFPVSTDLIDDIISFMSETIKYQQVKTTTDATILKQTHTKISDLCYSLIQHRHYFIVDRIPQFVTIVKELLQSICWYKSDRLHGKDLEDDEVTMLTELSHKTENIVKVFVKYAKDVKRIAPYFLLFIINLMISKENATTIYPKIKNHFDYICYDLISACDHRVEGFIMRNCNEASKQIYESMVKEYNKYHKFKGKV